ncbi:MAG: O-succinylbenzoate synthase [Glaciecola sp.]
MTPAKTLPLPGVHITLHPFEVPLRVKFRGVTSRRGVLLSGPSGWGEFSAFDEYDDEYAARWLDAAVAAARDPWPRAVRDTVPVNATVPAVDPATAQAIVREFNAATVKVKVAERGQTPGEDVERLQAVRDALGPAGAIRIDANAAWGVDEAVVRIAELDRAAGGLEYVEQPVRSLADMATVRKRVDVRIAADESIRTAEDPVAVAAHEAADLVVLKVQPLGGIRRAMQVAEACGLPVVVSSALETSVGLAAGVAFAAALPELPFACGLGTGLLLAQDVVARPLVPINGVIEVRRPSPTPALVGAATPTSDAAEALMNRLDRLVVIDSPFR